MPEVIVVSLLIVGALTFSIWTVRKLMQDGVGQRILALIESRKKSGQSTKAPASDPALEKWQKIVLQYAQHKDGRVRLEELVADTPLVISQATQALDSLLGLDLCDLEFDNDKHPVYIFKSFRLGADSQS